MFEYFHNSSSDFTCPCLVCLFNVYLRLIVYFGVANGARIVVILYGYCASCPVVPLLICVCFRDKVWQNCLFVC